MLTNSTDAIYHCMKCTNRTRLIVLKSDDPVVVLWNKWSLVVEQKNPTGANDGLPHRINFDVEEESSDVDEYREEQSSESSEDESNASERTDDDATFAFPEEEREEQRLVDIANPPGKSQHFFHRRFLPDAPRRLQRDIRIMDIAYIEPVQKMEDF